MPRRDPRLLRFARRMRSDPTPAEKILWLQLRRNEFEVRFRRQEPIARYIADFACRSHRVIVEVDGDSHTDEVRDQRRDADLRSLGWRVLRYADSEVYENEEAVLEDIWRAIHGEEDGERSGPAPPPLASSCPAEPFSPAPRERGRASPFSPAPGERDTPKG